MRTFKSIVTSTVIALVRAVAVTQPTLPEAVTQSIESPVLARIGVVAAIVESDNITVKISGSNVLVQASFLFPQYQPVLGDRVYVTKQDAQWFILGQMSGPVGANSLAPNSGFEQGAEGEIPDFWTFTVSQTTAGTPTAFRTTAGGAIDGVNVFRLNLVPTATGDSSARIASARIPASEGQHWISAFYVNAQVYTPNEISVFSELRFFDSTDAFIGDSYMIDQDFNAHTNWWYMRPFRGDLPAIAPAGTASVEMRITVFWTINTLIATSHFINFDHMILRNVT